MREKNNLTSLHIHGADMMGISGDNILANTLRSCTNLKSISLDSCNMTDEQLVPIVAVVRDHPMCEEFSLHGNSIRNAGCGTIATLLEEPDSNLRVLWLSENNISDAGTNVIANSLLRNSRLQNLYLDGNLYDVQNVRDVFSRLLCNMSSINDTHSSNHTLKTLELGEAFELGQESLGEQLRDLLKLNKGTNKSHVAIKKILLHHPNLDMGPLFQWDSEGEQTLKALPYVVDWFGKAEEAVAGDEENCSYRLDERKLSAIFQFAKTMPLLFVPASHIKKDDKKRKRNTR